MDPFVFHHSFFTYIPKDRKLVSDISSLAPVYEEYEGGIFHPGRGVYVEGKRETVFFKHYLTAKDSEGDIISWELNNEKHKVSMVIFND